MNDIVLAVLALISAVITGVLIPWIRVKTTAAQREQIAAWVKIAVTAAEQIANLPSGAEKKAYVRAWLKERGVDPDTLEIDAMIESAVYQLTK